MSKGNKVYIYICIHIYIYWAVLSYILYFWWVCGVHINNRSLEARGSYEFQPYAAALLLLLLYAATSIDDYYYYYCC